MQNSSNYLHAVNFTLTAHQVWKQQSSTESSLILEVHIIIMTAQSKADFQEVHSCNDNTISEFILSMLTVKTALMYHFSPIFYCSKQLNQKSIDLSFLLELLEKFSSRCFELVCKTDRCRWSRKRINYFEFKEVLTPFSPRLVQFALK